MKTKVRESNLELLRIIAMILIFYSHYVYWGIKNLETNKYFNNLIFDFLSLGGKIGVNIFVFISAWFLIEAKFSIKKLIVLILKVKIYTIIFLILAILLKEKLNLKLIMISFFPVLLKHYWFITCYIMLYIASPYLNLILIRLTKQEIKSILIISLTIFCILQTFIGNRLFYNEFIWFIILYFLTFYLKKYCVLKKSSLFLKIGLGAYISIFCISHISNYFNLDFYLIGEYTIAVLIISLTFFIYFLQLNLGYKKIINFISSSTLSVYLIHENIFGRNIIWEKVLKISKIINSDTKLVIIHIIGSVLLIFGLSILVDKMLECILNKFCNNKIDLLCRYLESKKQYIWDKIFKISEKFEKGER